MPTIMKERRKCFTHICKWEMHLSPSNFYFLNSSEKCHIFSNYLDIVTWELVRQSPTTPSKLYRNFAKYMAESMKKKRILGIVGWLIMPYRVPVINGRESQVSIHLALSIKVWFYSYLYCH